MGKYGGLPVYHQSLASGKRLLFFFFELEAMAMASLLIYSANGWMFHSFFVCLPDTRLAISHIIYYIYYVYNIYIVCIINNNIYIYTHM